MPRPAPPLPPLTSAQQQMVVDNLGLVGWTMNRYFRHALPDRLDDLWQEGVIGLIKAVHKYDPTRGTTFATMAIDWIHNSIQRGDGDYRGKNYRSHLAGREPLPRDPKSIDLPYRSHAEMPQTIGERLHAIPDEAALLVELSDVFGRHCQDATDALLVEVLLACPGLSDAALIRQAQTVQPTSFHILKRRLDRLRTAAAKSLGLHDVKAAA